MDIRLANKLDIPDLVRLNDQVQLQHAEQYPDLFKYPVNSTDVTLFFSKLIESRKNTVIVAFNDTELIAYLYFEVQRTGENPFTIRRPRYYIHQIHVETTKRRSAVATALFQWVEKTAKVEGIDRIELDTYMLNKDAHEFFETAGFTASKLIYTKNLA